MLITRKVDLSHERNCRKRSLLSDTESAQRYLLEIFSLFDVIQALQIEYENEIYTLDDLCVRTEPGGPCKVMSVLSAWNYSSEALLADPDPIHTLQGAVFNSDSLNGFLLDQVTQLMNMDSLSALVTSWGLIEVVNTVLVILRLCKAG